MIDTERKFIFIHIPKTAGSAVTITLFPELKEKWGTYKGHFLPDEYDQETWDSFFSFCFIRNPWDRMVSLYHYWNDGKYEGLPKLNISFADFCLNFPNFILPSAFYHRQPQVDYVYGKNKKVKFIATFENLNSDFKLICEHIGIEAPVLPHFIPNTREKNYALYYNQETKDFVSEYFAEDIKLGNYQFEE